MGALFIAMRSFVRIHADVVWCSMKDTKLKPSGVAGDLGRLKAVRGPMLTLHKALVESERVEYERTIGKIRSPNHFLQLLTTDPWFAWLSPLSQLIVSIDEALDAEEKPTQDAVDALVSQTVHLLMPSETGSGFSKHYFEAMQRDPDVVLAHGAVVHSRNNHSPKS